MKTRKFNSDEI